MLQVDIRVARGSDGEHALALRVPDCALHGLPNRTLTRVVAAVELPRVDEVAVVRDLHPVLGGPDEAADRRLGIDEARVVDDLDRGDLHARGHTGDADAVDRGCDRARDVRAVAGRGRVPGGLAVSTTPPRQDALLSFAICVARSGWVLEMPLSSTPTTTSGLPVVTAFASGVSI